RISDSVWVSHQRSHQFRGGHNETHGGVTINIDSDFTDATVVGTTTCSSSCSGKVCGSDGCGGSCGSCGAGTTCNSSGQCVGSGTQCSACPNGNECATGYSCFSWTGYPSITFCAKDCSASSC